MKYISSVCIMSLKPFFFFQIKIDWPCKLLNEHQYQILYIHKLIQTKGKVSCIQPEVALNTVNIIIILYNLFLV